MSKCPCLIADEPCQERCSCVMPHSSFGCLCCAQYGSESQRKAAATSIIKALREQNQKYIEEWNRNITEGHPEKNVNA